MLNGNDLDRSITGNWGEDSFAPGFVTVGDLADFDLEPPLAIDAPVGLGQHGIFVTVTKVSVVSGVAYVETRELNWPLMIPEDKLVRFVDE